MRQAVNEIDKDTKAKKLRLLARRLVQNGLGGDVTALKEIGDRLDGKVPQALTGADGGQLTVVVRKFADA